MVAVIDSGNGVFQFEQTNASGTTNVGTVTSPISGETLSGVKAEQISVVGTKEVVGEMAPGAAVGAASGAAKAMLPPGKPARASARKPAAKKKGWKG